MNLLREITCYGETTIVIDALDECRPDQRYILFEALHDLRNQSEGLVKIFVSSRRESDIIDSFSDSLTLKIEPKDNLEDITRFVTVELDKRVKSRRLLHGNVSHTLKTEIKDRLLRDATGMQAPIANVHTKLYRYSLTAYSRFRWVSTSLQTLCNSHTMHLEADVRNALGRLPAELDNLYSIIIKDINDMGDSSRDLAKTVLRWLLSAKQALSSEEFVRALNTGLETVINREDVLNVCNNLVQLDETVDSFQFVHISIREYLEKQPEYQEVISNATIASSCLAMCLYGKKPKRRQENSTTQNKLFYDYAQIYWPVHCEIAEERRTEGELGKHFRAFLCGGSRVTKAFLTWRNGWWESWKALNLSQNRLDDQEIYNKLQDCDSVVYTACVFGFVEVIQDRMLVGKNDSAERSGFSRDYIATAIAYGQQKVILQLQSTTHLSALNARKARLLVAAAKREVQFVADMLMQDSSLAITHAVIESAASSNDVEMVKYLIDHCKINPMTITNEMLVMATVNEKHGCEVLEFLLDQVPDVEITLPEEALEQACMNSRCGLQIITTLLAKKRSFRITDELIRYAAANETENGRLVKLLLSGGHKVQVDEEMLIDVANSKTPEGLEALLPHTNSQDITSQVLLVASGNQECANRLIPLLLQRCDSVIITDDVLCEAVFNRQYGLEVFKCLLSVKNGISINPRVLESVVMSEFNGEIILRELLQLNLELDLNSKVLQYTVENESCGTKLLEIILENTKNVNINEEVLCNAAGNSNWGTEILKILFNHYPNLPISSNLVVAAAVNDESGYEIMELLSSHSGMLEVTAEAVEEAASNPHNGRKILDFWLKEGVSLEISQLAILRAARNSILGAEIMQLLLEISRTVDISREAVEIAARNENCGDKILRLMVELRGSIPISVSAFKNAAVNPECGLNIIKFLLEQEVSTPVLFEAIDELLCYSNVSQDSLDVLLENAHGFVPGSQTIENEANVMREGGKMLQSLIHKNPGVYITNLTIRRIIEFSEDAIKGWNLLVKYKPDLEITDRIFLAAILNENNTASTVQALIDQSKTRNWDQFINETALNCAIQKDSSEGIAVFRFLVEWKLSRGETSLISESLVASAARCPRAEKHLKFLADKARECAIPFPLTRKVYLAAAESSKISMKTLREMDPELFEKFSVDEEVLLNVVGDSEGYRILKLFSDTIPSWQNKVTITTRMLGESSDARLRFLLQIIDHQHNGTIPSDFVTEELIKRIADGPITDLMSVWDKLPAKTKQLGLAKIGVKRAFFRCKEYEVKLLFSWIRGLLRDQNLENLRHDLISEEFVLAALTNQSDAAFSLVTQLNFMETANNRVPGITITENLLLGAAAEGNISTLIYLLHRYHGLRDHAYYLGIARLRIAVNNDDPPVIHSLLQEGVSPDFKDSRGFTPLTEASYFGYYPSAKALLENSQDIDVNSTSSIIDWEWKWGICRGRTPLCWAALNGRIHLVELLLQHGADPLIRDSNGMNAEDLAVEAGRDIVAKVLRNWRG